MKQLKFKSKAIPGEEDLNARSDPHAEREAQTEPTLNVRAAKEWGTYTQVHHELLSHPAVCSLTLPALQILLDLLRQFTGNNNGQLTAKLSDLQKVYGWGHSPQTLKRALETLTRRRLVIQTRKRVGPKEATYALTWITNRKERQA